MFLVQNVVEVPLSFHRQWMYRYPNYVLFNCDSTKHFIRVRRYGRRCFFADGLKACLQSATISILINGSPTQEFAPTRGLRQGDPLAPMLFNIVAEGLTGMMRVATSKGLYRSYLVGKQKSL